jgi:Putative prokaryotic signal transducing protein
MIELLRTNNLVLISAIRALLTEDGIYIFVADEHMSSLEGSVGFLPRRILVRHEDLAPSRRLLEEAGLGGELKLG